MTVCTPRTRGSCTPSPLARLDGGPECRGSRWAVRVRPERERLSQPLWTETTTHYQLPPHLLPTSTSTRVLWSAPAAADCQYCDAAPYCRLCSCLLLLL